MAITFATPLAQARSLLNDPTGAIYQDAPMISLGNKVYKELQNKLTALGIQTTKEISSVLPVTAGTVALSDGAGLPTDFISPISLKEAAVGSNIEDYVTMTEMDFEPSLTVPDTVLGFWAFREDEIKFPACSVNRSVLMKYVKSMGSITATTSTILILNSTEWIAQRLASVAALSLGHNPSRAQALDLDLNKEGGVWDDLRAVVVKRKQNIPVRRKRTRYRVL